MKDLIEWPQKELKMRHEIFLALVTEGPSESSNTRVALFCCLSIERLQLWIGRAAVSFTTTYKKEHDTRIIFSDLFWYAKDSLLNFVLINDQNQLDQQKWGKV